MNLNQLEVLVAIVETGSLTNAAVAVGLTQSAVSHSLNRLETELGVTLLERGRGGVEVTRIGKEVLQHARHILAQTEAIRQKTARERGVSVGKLRFGCVPNLPPHVLTGIIRDFQHQYPQIETVLFEGNALDLMSWLETGVIDVGTVLTPEPFADSRPFVVNETQVLMSADHWLADQTAVRWEEIAAEPLIGPRAEYTMVTQLPQLQNIPFPRLQYDVSAYSTIFVMVREKMGISLMPGLLSDPTAEGVVMRPLEPTVRLHVYLAAQIKSPVNQAFMRHAHTWAKERGLLPAD